jgi:hypothetical protein
MKLQAKSAAVLAVLALGLVPALAGATSYAPEYHPEPPHPEAPKGHAYGYYCKGFSKKHVKGEKGTPFSQCVHTMKVADHNDAITARKACKQFKGQKHVPHGDKGTPFSRCIREVNKLRKENDESTVTTSAVVS